MTSNKPHTDKAAAANDKDQAGHDLDPRAELGLKRPTQADGTAAQESMDDDAKLKRQEAEGHKATQFDGNPNPEGAQRSTFGPKDDTPMRLKKKEGPNT